MMIGALMMMMSDHLWMMMDLKPLHLIGGAHDDVALGDGGAPVGDWSC